MQKYIASAVSSAERFVGKNITLPILGNILFEARGNFLKIIATNLEYAAEVHIPAHVTREGVITVPAKIISSLIHSIKDDKIELEEKQGILSVKTETFSSKVNGIQAEEFPFLPKIKKIHSCTLEANVLSNGLNQVLPAVALTEFKPELTGVFFSYTNNELRLAATDTFRLAEKVLAVEGQKNVEQYSFILPYRVGQEVSRIFAGRDDMVTIFVGEGQILFEGDGVRVYGRLIDGVFPEYTAIIPKNFGATGHILKQELTDAVRSASIFASKIQEITLSFQKNTLGVRASNQEIGEHAITIPCSFVGKESTASFNFRYLLDGLTAIGEEEIFFGCNTEQSPSLMRSKSDGSYFYIVMPIRLN